LSESVKRLLPIFSQHIPNKSTGCDKKRKPHYYCNNFVYTANQLSCCESGWLTLWGQSYCNNNQAYFFGPPCRIHIFISPSGSKRKQ